MRVCGDVQSSPTQSPDANHLIDVNILNSVTTVRTLYLSISDKEVRINTS